MRVLIESIIQRQKEIEENKNKMLAILEANKKKVLTMVDKMKGVEELGKLNA